MADLSSLDPTQLATPAFIFLMLVEAAWLARHRQEGYVGYAGKDSAASLTMGTVYSLIYMGWKGVEYAFYSVLYELTPLRLGNGLLAWVLLFFAEDLCYYWFHRVHHESRFFWASHVVHHSSQHYNLSTALRQTWTPMTGLLFWAPLPLLGFHPAMVLTAPCHEPALPVLDPHRGHRPHGPARVGAQHALAPPRPPRRQRALPG